MKYSVNWNHFWRERHSKPSRQCYFKGKKNCDPKVANRHYKEEATLSTSWLRQHDETHLRYCILASNVTWDTTSGRKLWHLHRPRNKKETLRCMKKGKPRGAKIGVDLFKMKGRNYLVTVDYYWNCLKVDYLSTTMTKQVITKLKGHFATYGIPLQMVTDSAPQFLSWEFRKFSTEWVVQHAKTSSPEHHQSNGQMEAAVKITKTMCKALRDGTDQNEALLELTNTPHQDTGVSPAEMMFGKNTRLLLLSTGTKRTPSKK